MKGANPFEGERGVILAVHEELNLLVPEGQPLRRVWPQAAAVH